MGGFDFLIADFFVKSISRKLFAIALLFLTNLLLDLSLNKGAKIDLTLFVVLPEYPESGADCVDFDVELFWLALNLWQPQSSQFHFHIISDIFLKKCHKCFKPVKI